VQIPKKTIPFTKEKYEQMQQKVADLLALRVEVMERLVTAREMGDLSENGAYKYAKFELGNIGRELKKYQGLLDRGYTQERSAASRQVIDFGSVVTVQHSDNPEKNKTFTIVSKHESNPVAGLLAFSSPIGRAVMKKKIGDSVEVLTPRGTVSYLITEIN